MGVVHHELNLADRAAMLAMRAALATGTKPALRPESRPGFDEIIARAPAPDGVLFEAGDVGGVGGWWCRPPNGHERAAILYLHGGAYVLGSAAAYRHFAGQLAMRAGVSTFVLDYSLAPERPFPAAPDDVRATFDALPALGVDRIALCGDSAGGGLALSLLLETARTPRAPLGAVALSPWIDLSLSGDTMTTRADADPLLSREALSEAARLYLDGRDPHSPRVSTLHGDFAGLPPVRLHVGDAEVLLDDALRFGKLSEAAGGICDVHVWEGMVHVFPSNLAVLRASGEALDDAGSFLRDLLIKP